MAIEKSPHYGSLQKLVDALFEREETVARLDAIILAEAFDLPADLKELVNLLPPGRYTRLRLCDQINSSVAGHGWGYVYGTVE
ncbi:MAG: hypothetical protein LBG81_04330 [Coriobacteriaceae bacterium]|jgi:hypothetical protein|nr:hypothetical protein [Coriobacteriaceae bacterium]